MNPFLVGYIGMLGIFMTHAIARAAHSSGFKQAMYLTEPLQPCYSSNPYGSMLEVEKKMEKYVAEQHIPFDILMQSSSEWMRNDMEDRLKRDLEHAIFDGIKEHITIEEFKEDGRRDPPFPCKVFRASIMVGRDEY